MKKLEFNIKIDATPEKVWNIIIGKDTYPEWTAIFCEGSAVETDWEKGSKALFLDGKGSGMVAEIEENIPNEFLSIKHLGEISNGVEDTMSEKVKEWAGAHENYTLQAVDGQTLWKTEIDVTPDFIDYMNDTWPKAQEKVKEMAEKV